MTEEFTITDSDCNFFSDGIMQDLFDTDRHVEQSIYRNAHKI